MQHFLKSNFVAAAQGLVLLVMLVIGWADSTDIVIIYALETILIGIFHVAKMLVISFYGNHEISTREAGIIVTLFFIVHYGFFVFIQTTLFFTFLSMGDDRIIDERGLGNFITAIHFEGVQAAALVIFVTLIIKLFRNFLVPKKYKNVDPKIYMIVPYLRIIVQQFVAILPGIFIVFFNGGFIAAIVLIVFRTAFDMLLSHLKGSDEALDKAAVYLAKPRNGEESKTTPEEIRSFLKMVVDE